jgi:hypothetical protein
MGIGHNGFAFRVRVMLGERCRWRLLVAGGHERAVVGQKPSFGAAVVHGEACEQSTTSPPGPAARITPPGRVWSIHAAGIR